MAHGTPGADAADKALALCLSTLRGQIDQSTVSQIVFGVVDGLPWREYLRRGLIRATFDDFRVPEDNLPARRGRGYALSLSTLDNGRVAIAALSVELIQARLEADVQEASEGNVMGGTIGREPGIAFQVADLDVMRQAPRGLTYDAAAMRDAILAGPPGARPWRSSSTRWPRLYTSESAVTATRIATQVFGGCGFHGGIPSRSLVPRRQDSGDRRRYLRGAAQPGRPEPRPTCGGGS